MKVVLDTNVFISGIFFRGPPYLALKAWRDGMIKLVVSEKILEEYLRVGEILSKQYSQIRLGPILELIMAEAEFTADLKLLRVSGYGGIDVVTPRKFVDSFLKNMMS